MICATCGDERRADNDWTDFKTCVFCERSYCAPHYERHQCRGHEAEVADCLWCDEEIVLGFDPVMTVDGQRFHTRCVQSKEFQAALSRHHSTPQP